MTQITVSVEGAELVRKGLQDLAAELPKIGRAQIWYVMQRVLRRMQEYPAERPQQKYVRTGTLFYRWGVQSLEDGYTIDNNASRKGHYYAKFVVGNAYGTDQAWMHKGRWPLLRDVADEETQKLPEAISRHIDMVARREGLKQ